VLNKVDRVDAAALAEVFAGGDGAGDGGAIVTTEHGRLDPGLLFDLRERPKPAQLSFDDVEDHAEHVHALYQSVVFTSDEPMHPSGWWTSERPAGRRVPDQGVCPLRTAGALRAPGGRRPPALPACPMG